MVIVVVVIIVVITRCLNADISLTFLIQIRSFIRNLISLRRLVLTNAYRIAFLAGQGLLVILAGQIEESSGNIPFAWMITFLILAGLFVIFLFYLFIEIHRAIFPL